MEPDAGKEAFLNSLVSAGRIGEEVLIGDALAAATRLVLDADQREQRVRVEIAAEIEQFADDDSDVSDAYRHAALIAKGVTP